MIDMVKNNDKMMKMSIAGLDKLNAVQGSLQQEVLAMSTKIDKITNDLLAKRHAADELEMSDLLFAKKRRNLNSHEQFAID